MILAIRIVVLIAVCLLYGGYVGYRLGQDHRVIERVNCTQVGEQLRTDGHVYRVCR